ncbi:MAG TPA: hypothetical protein ENK43_17455 [Planctomycetes bacterium]|nr:hypothetical protein [Planctomycetota bacterium]
MELQELKQRTEATMAEKALPRGTRRLAYEFSDLLGRVTEMAESDATPSRTRGKAWEFLACLTGRAAEHGEQFHQEAFLLNFVGEALVQSDYRNEAVLDFMKTGLYFYGLAHIERFHRAQSFSYMSAHAELISDYFSRAAMKSLVRFGRERIAEGRPFCLVHHYLNALKKRYWATRREEQDALSVSVSLDAVGDADVSQRTSSSVSDRLETAEGAESEDRVALMIRIFGTRLTELQQRIYLHRHPVAVQALYDEEGRLEDELRSLVSEARGDEGARLTWMEISQRYGLAEKSAKREYLRSLVVLLGEAAEAVHTDLRQPHFVRRVLRSLRSVIQERDLKLRDGSGRGLGRIVERWEIALRLVLNNIRVTVGEAESGGREVAS